MSRVIKFRALKDDHSNCNFIYGELVYDAIGQPRITHKDSSGKGLTFNTCIKGTEGQFTGLHDKNGREIYEGDIVTHEDTENDCVIVFEIESCMYLAQELVEGGLGFGVVDTKEIIGNIHENPKLL